MALYKVISGGQTGADQGGLLAAWRVGFLTGGTAPANFLTSRGVNPLLEVLGLRAEGNFQTRTRKNIDDAHATLIFAEDSTSSGTVLTINHARKTKKPFLVIDISNLKVQDDHLQALVQQVYDFLIMVLSQDGAIILNIAGNRERYDDGRITRLTERILLLAFKKLPDDLVSLPL